MEDVSKKEGRTVLFVSHNMAAVSQICTKGIVLSSGTVHFSGSQEHAIQDYSKSNQTVTASLRNRTDRKGSGEIRITGIDILDENREKIDYIKSGQNIQIVFHYETSGRKTFSNVLMSFLIKTPVGVSVFLQHNRLTNFDFGELPERGSFVCRIPHLPLPPSVYNLIYTILPAYGSQEDYYDSMDNAISLNVISGDYFKTGEVPPSTHGVCLVDATWELAKDIQEKTIA